MKRKMKSLLVFLSTMMVLGIPVNINAANIYQPNNINEISIDPIGQLTPTLLLTKEQKIASDLDVQEEMELLVGQEKQLDYTTDADQITFTSSDETIATVDEDGNVTAVSKGTAFITAATDDYDLDCEVTVYDEAQVTAPEDMEILLGESKSIDFTSIKNDDDVFCYRIDDTDIVEYDEVKHAFNGLEEGSTIIHVFINDFKKEKLSINVDVVSDVYLHVNNLTVVKGEEKPLAVNTNTDETIEYSSANKKIATVDDEGNVTGVKKGSTTITAKIGDVETTAQVTVKAAVTADAPQKFEVVKGEHKNLGVTTASIKKITYYTSDSEILTINSNGTIKAKENGTATVTVEIGTKAYKCQVTVTDEIKVDTPDTMEVVLDEYKPIEVETNSVKTPVYTSSDESIFTVDEYGFVHALKEGTATLTTTIGDVKDETEVTVVKDITLTCQDTLNVVKSEKKTLDYTTNSTLSITFTSSNKSVATVTANGVVKGKKAGTATITVTIGDLSEECKVTVDSSIYVKVTPSLTINQGETQKLDVDTNSSKTVKYTSNKSSIAKVSSDGTITGVKEGSATITVKVGGKTDTCKVTVKKLELTTEKESYTLDTGGNANLNVSSSAEIGEITYTSNNESVVKVNSDGTITAVGPGTATITATANGTSTTCTVTVNQPSVKIAELDTHSNGITFDVGGSGTFHASVKNNGTLQPTWSSSNSNVVSINSSTGAFTCPGAGTAVITLTVGSQTSSITATVKAKQVVSSGNSSGGGSGGSGTTTQSSRTVWIPNTGSKYHSNPNCSNMKNPTAVSEQEAINRGYQKCKKCW